MRIAVVSTTTYPTPPLWYGGEIFYWHLARGLCELGHEVTIYGAPGSRPGHDDCGRCRLRYVLGTYGEITVSAEFATVDHFYTEIIANDYVLDCSHMHAVAENAGWYHRRDHSPKIAVVLNGVTSNTPRCGPYNVVVGSQKWLDLVTLGRTQFYGTSFASAYGESLAEPILPHHIAGVVHWATDVEFYTPGQQKGDHLLWLSRPTDYKGLHDAIEIAMRVGRPLKIAPGFGVEAHYAEFNAYKPVIEAALADGADIEVVRLPLTSRHHEAKRDLYRDAAALIYPIGAHEPFGLVVVEALSCGTPVVAYDRGAMPEIIKSGSTGFLCEDIDGAVEAVKAIGDIDPAACREDAVERWHYVRAAREYIDLLTERGVS